MKTMKRMMTVLVVLAMLLSMACSGAYAETVDITIDGAKAGHTYKLYKLMDLTYDSVAGTYTYEAADNWIDFFKTKAGSTYVTLDSSNQVTWKVEESEETAKALAAAALAAGIAADGEKVAGDTVLTFTGMDSGYYVLESSAGTFVTLKSVYSGTVALNEKNDLPKLTKNVKNAEDTAFAESADAEIGDNVNYKIEVAVKSGAKDYVITDTLPTGITLLGIPVVTGDGMSEEHYTAEVAGNGFTVTVKEAYLAGLEDGEVFTITYSGIVTNAITTGAAGNINTAELNVSGVTASSDTAAVKSYEIDVEKVDASTSAPLAGAQFKLYNESNQYIQVADNGGVLWGTEDAATTFTTDSNGAFEIRGLMPGTYKLKETAAPAGYKLLSDDADAAIADDNITVTVKNSKATILPETGGMGTTLFYGFGAVLMAGAAVLLISKKRREN